jgi:hypothetical protein
MNPTKPSLARIEARWFSPSDRLLTRIAQGDSTVPDALRRAIDGDPEYRRCVDLLHVAATDPDSAQDSTLDSKLQNLSPPVWLLDLAEPRAAANARLSGASLQPGSLVAIDRLIGPEGELPIDLASTAAVLLDDREESHGIWHGWLAAPEIGYATAYDFVLDDQDGPFDPSLAGMVQLWNPVRVYADTVDRVIGQLPPERLRAVRALAGEYLTRPALGESAKAQEPLGPRLTLGGYAVTTGTSLKGPTDARWRYQEIYLKVGQAIGEPARAALAARPWWESLWEALAEVLAGPSAPAPAVPMGDRGEPVPVDGILAGRFRIGLNSRDPGVLSLRAIRLADDGSTLRLLRNDRIVQQCRAEDSEKTFLLDDAGIFALEVVDAEGQVIERVDLSEPEGE